MEGLICPKCHGVMRSYERSGVTVDQCTECRGVFLDRGELERLVDAENAHYGGDGAPAAVREEPRRQEYREEPRRQEYREEHRGGYGHKKHGYGHKKKKRSFLEDLFE
jgi:Zn-finger nucleic acid-binding protein